MNEFKGTPGPWEYEDGDIWSGDELVTAIIDEFQPKDIHLHNANLIAAAPDLLISLLSALEWIDAVPSNTELPTMPGFDRDEVNNIIAKAIGEQP